MKGKIFTPDEANRMLPLVAQIADDIVATYALVHETLQELEALKAQVAQAETEAPRREPVSTLTTHHPLT